MDNVKHVTGTRDFYGYALQQRHCLIDVISDVYKHYGYECLETSAFEYMSLLNNVYGDDNDKLLYRVLNSCENLNNIANNDISNISNKCLRYDLTMPLVRYVTENKGNIIFPFKRYQIQPVWRADRPQKGRFREFYQCDVDIVGEKSILAEVEMLQIAVEVLKRLGIMNYKIRINHRYLLFNITQMLGIEDRFLEFCCYVDKIDKCGIGEFFVKYISAFNINPDKVQILNDVMRCSDSNDDKIHLVRDLFIKNKIDTKAIDELNTLLCKIKMFLGDNENIIIDYSLARGLNYYTGIIFEVTLNDASGGSIAGGGRYDYFADKLNTPELQCVGFSFGIDRLLIALDELKISLSGTNIKHILFINDDDYFDHDIIRFLRKKYIVEIFLDKNINMKHQLKYANKKKIDKVIFKHDNKYIVKDMITGLQTELDVDDLENI